MMKSVSCDANPRAGGLELHKCDTNTIYYSMKSLKVQCWRNGAINVHFVLSLPSFFRPLLVWFLAQPVLAGMLETWLHVVALEFVIVFFLCGQAWGKSNHDLYWFITPCHCLHWTLSPLPSYFLPLLIPVLFWMMAFSVLSKTSKSFMFVSSSLAVFYGLDLCKPGMLDFILCLWIWIGM